MQKSELKKIVECLLFISEDVQNTKEIKKQIDEVDVSENDIEEAISLLNNDYMVSERSFEIRSIAGGWQLRTTDAMKAWIHRFSQKKQRQKLTERALETLAIIAYNQPITKGQIEEIRGVNSDGIVRSLLEKELISISGREKSPGNPMLYVVTKKFLIHFGLESTKDLPNLKEINELLESDESLLKEVSETIQPEQLGISFNEK